MSYKITIPKPCSESWNQMTPTQKGAFCKSCAKEVLDFTNSTKRELSKRISTEDNICGRFKPEQLDTPLPKVSQTKFRRNAAMLGFTSLLAIGTPLAAQQNIPEINEIETSIVLGRIAVTPITPPKENIIQLEGVVTDGEYPLPGATIFIKGTRVSATTDFDGNFDLSISDLYKDSKITLVVSYLGFVPVEKPVLLNSKSISISLTEMEEAVMGELVIIRKQNIFRRIGNLFRKQH